MKMYGALSLLMTLIVGASFAADAPVPSRVIPTGATNNTVSENADTSSKSRAAGRNTTTDVMRTTTRPTSDNVGETSSQNVIPRSVTARGGYSVGTTKQSDINSNSAIRRAGLTLRPSVAEFGGRAIIAGTNQQTGSNIDEDIRKVTGRAANKETIAEAKERLEQTAELNKSCQEQYNECMDQFCSVVDANQKRCSCSANLSKYSKVEEAVNAANAKLNEVAQNIRYIGLSADEIRAIMTATEAEEALSGTRDTTENRNMLEQIENMIKDPKTYTASYTDDGFGLDMDLNFSADADMFSLDFLNTNTSSFSNLRGSELYNAARNRCNTVLNQCKKAGATTQQVTGNYDLAIDKDCIAYEAGLKKLNETLVSNVRSAERMLQKARLAVRQNKNQYDAKGCIGALEACMTDEMVCGDDYAKCVDPTKKYIDENGNVVLGQDISKITEVMQYYDSSQIDESFLKNAYEMTINSSNCNKHTETQNDSSTEKSGGDGSCTVKYLLQKIGTKQEVTKEGLCRAVLDKCQVYTYDEEDKYDPYNYIVLNYIQRAMVNIKASQNKVIADYASRCVTDVAACYNQQVTQVSAWSQSTNVTNIYNIMNGACRNVALTCGLAIFGGVPKITTENDVTIEGVTYTISNCPEVSTTTTEAAKNNAIIGCISEMFYQSLLCPENSTYDKSASSTQQPSPNLTATNAYVNTKCKCNDGYVTWNGSCVPKCGTNQPSDYNTYGQCVSN